MVAAEHGRLAEVLASGRAEAALPTRPAHPRDTDAPPEKRRIGAVILDHLTPPLTRAESYGPLKQLEALVDEYYLAAGMDPRRLDRLRRDIIDLARLYAATNDKLGIYWLHVAAEDLKWQDRWQAVARSKLRDDFFRMRSELAEQILRRRGRHEIPEAVDRWLAARSTEVDRFKHLIEEMKLRPEIDFAPLSVAAREFRDLIST